MSEGDDSCVIIASGRRDDYCDTTSVGVFFMVSQAMWSHLDPYLSYVK